MLWKRLRALGRLGVAVVHALRWSTCQITWRAKRGDTRRLICGHFSMGKTAELAEAYYYAVEPWCISLLRTLGFFGKQTTYRLNLLDFITVSFGIPIIKTNKRRIFLRFRNLMGKQEAGLLIMGHKGSARNEGTVNPQ